SAVNTSVRPTATVADPGVTPVTLGSAIVTPSMATFPVLRTEKVYTTSSPRSAMPLPFASSSAACFSISIPGSNVGVDTESSGDVTVAPPGVVPEPVATLSTTPSSTSCAVTVYGSAVKVAEALGARDATVTGVRPVSIASVAETSCSVTLPVLVSTIVYEICSPSSATPLPLTSSSAAVLSATIAPIGSGTSTMFVTGSLGTVPPPGALPVTVASLSTWPASTSACVTVYGSAV